MNRLRHSKILSALWLFLTVWIFNYSIDIPDPQNDSVREDLTYNDIESISELIFEYCLGWEDFVTEHDEDDPDDRGGVSKKIELVYVWKFVPVKVVAKTFVPGTEHFFNYSLKEPEIPFIPGVTKPPQA